jgi:DHA2 family multidrug resistance protein
MFVTGAAIIPVGADRGQLARVMDLRVMLAIGLLMFGGGLWWMAELTVDSAFWELFDRRRCAVRR